MRGITLGRVALTGLLLAGAYLWLDGEGDEARAGDAGAVEVSRGMQRASTPPAQAARTVAN